MSITDVHHNHATPLFRVRRFIANEVSAHGREVRRQTRDLVALLELAKPLGAYYMFMEDDFMCDLREASLSLPQRFCNATLTNLLI